MLSRPLYLKRRKTLRVYAIRMLVRVDKLTRAAVPASSQSIPGVTARE